MPPAFNLSQDQTLHLKSSISSKSLNRRWPHLDPLSHPKRTRQDWRPHPLRNESVFASCEHLICLFTPSQHHSRDTTPERHDIQAPTPIGCKFLRNRLLTESPANVRRAAWQRRGEIIVAALQQSNPAAASRTGARRPATSPKQDRMSQRWTSDQAFD